MIPYPKIQSIWKRDPDNNYRTFLFNEFSTMAIMMLADLKWDWYEKVDGTNIRIIFTRYANESTTLEFRGRSDKAYIPPDLVRALEEMFWNDLFEDVFEGEGQFTLYGEGYGPGIQKGGCYREDKSFILFDVMVNGMWLTQDAVSDIAAHLEIDRAARMYQEDIPGIRGLFELNAQTPYAGLRSVVADERCFVEGLIGRPPVDLFDRRGNRVITKIKIKDFPREEYR